MKIGFDGRFIRQGRTGNGVFTQLFLEGLSRLDHENDYTVYLIEENSFIQQRNFRLKRMPALHSNPHLRFLLTFPLEMLKNPVDIFHAIYTAPVWVTGKLVLTLVEFSWFLNPEIFPASSSFLSQLRLMTRQSVKRAHRIVTPTSFCREQLLDFFKIPGERVQVIPFGFNECFLAPLSAPAIEKAQEKYSIRGEYILAVGDLHPRKNLLRLIDAFQMLKETKKIPHNLVLVGKEFWRADSIYGKAFSGPCRDSVIFTGYVPQDDLCALYQGATVFAFPSLDEGFGLPVHEAMASRTPVIISRIGALLEIADGAAVTVDPHSVEEIGAAIFKLIDDRELRDFYIAKGLERIQKFRWEQSCRKLLKLYRDLA